MKNLAFIFLSTFFFALLSSSTSFAENRYALIWGGNCDWNNADFSDSMIGLTNQLSVRNWKVTLGYDKSADEVSSAFPDSFQNQIKNGSKKTLFDFLDQVAQSGKIGDEVFLGINTHGSLGTDGKVHGWALDDCSILPVDDPALNAKLEAVYQKNIKVMISDDSCYSGSSVNQLGNYGCVVTGQNSVDESIPANGFMYAATNVLMSAVSPHVTAADLFGQELRDQSTEVRMNVLLSPQMSGLLELPSLIPVVPTMVPDRPPVKIGATQSALELRKFIDGMQPSLNGLDSNLTLSLTSDENNLMPLLQTQDSLNDDIVSLIGSTSDIAQNPIVIELSTVDSRLKAIVSEIPNFREASEGRPQYEFRNGSLLIYWNLLSRSPEEIASIALSKLGSSEFGIKISDWSGLDSAIQQSCSKAKNQFLNDLTASQRDKFQLAITKFPSDERKLSQLQIDIQAKALKIDQDLRSIKSFRLSHTSNSSTQACRRFEF